MKTEIMNLNSAFPSDEKTTQEQDIDSRIETVSFLIITPIRESDHESENRSGISSTSEEVAQQIRALTAPTHRKWQTFVTYFLNLEKNKLTDVTERSPFS